MGSITSGSAATSCISKPGATENDSTACCGERGATRNEAEPGVPTCLPSSRSRMACINTASVSGATLLALGPVS